MKVKDIKQRLWNLGHCNNTDTPLGLTYDQWMRVSSTSPEFKVAMRSFQEFMGAAYEAVYYGRYQAAPTYTGELGPASKDLFAVPRCGHPDYPVEGQPAGGRGSWPEGCDPEWPDDHVFKIYLNKSNMPSFLGSKTDPNSACEKALYNCMESYWRVGLRMIRVESTSEADSLMSFQRGAGWIGLAIVPGSFSCNMSRIWAKFDTRYNPSQLIDQWARLFAHELGHNCGWGHWRGGIMNPSIIGGVYDIDEWVNDPSYGRVEDSFGGDRLDPWPDEDPDNPDPPTPPGNGEPLEYRGSVETYGKNTGKFYGHVKLVDVPPPGGF